ncbi:AlpA family phage regulatory protein [Candidatus Accumulibacter sp. ACC007]|uniref:helix-turn-helix transcriptional regulator n=1 Tax=Candidatus Accumulibacter sp. ACC007 TaxID=2823333 RepID=UPI0025B94E3B|nr:AlpA family phage regulatory protein [Candidatus Accumulibacter sp. ACC007]
MLFRLPEVVDITQRSKSQIYRDVAAGSFPAPVKIGARASAWRGEDVQLWLNALKPLSREVAA